MVYLPLKRSSDLLPFMTLMAYLPISSPPSISIKYLRSSIIRGIPLCLSGSIFHISLIYCPATVTCFSRFPSYFCGYETLSSISLVQLCARLHPSSFPSHCCPSVTLSSISPLKHLCLPDILLQFLPYLFLLVIFIYFFK